MSNIISEVVKIQYNSFTMAPALLSFFENCEVKKDNILLLYLLFPVVMNRDWIDGAPRVQRRSRLESWVKDNRIQVEGLPERITTFQRLSETTLQFCIDMEYVAVNEMNNVVVKYNPYRNRGRFTESAIRLTKLIGNNSPSKVYATLGIKELELV